MTKLVMFDMDGTLVDSRADLGTALNMMLADFSLPSLSLAEVAALLGDGREVFVKKALDARGGEDVDVYDAMERMGRYYDRHMVEKTVLYEGMADVLGQLRERGIKIGVITNKQQTAAQMIVEELQLTGIVDSTVGDDGRVLLKPAPDMLLAMMAEFGVTANDCWMIGDNHTDINAAESAGVRSCFCDYGFGLLDGAVPNARVQRASEILSLVLA